MTKTATKTRKVIISNVSIEQAQAAASEYTGIATKLAGIEAKMNEAINKVKDKYKEEITDLQEQIKQPADTLETFAKEQKESWGKKKSLELLHAVIGFRTGNPKVSKVKKFSWDAVLELMQKNNVFGGFLRKTVEINKEAILAEKDEAVLNQLKEECYVFVDQDEAFFINPKVETVAA